jgi:hypothetical protein
MQKRKKWPIKIEVKIDLAGMLGALTAILSLLN